MNYCSIFRLLFRIAIPWLRKYTIYIQLQRLWEYLVIGSGHFKILRKVNSCDAIHPRKSWKNMQAAGHWNPTEPSGYSSFGSAKSHRIGTNKTVWRGNKHAFIVERTDLCYRSVILLEDSWLSITLLPGFRESFANVGCSLLPRFRSGFLFIRDRARAEYFVLMYTMFYLAKRL